MRHAALLLLLCCGTASAADRPDILVTDFEGETYGEGWKTTGTAFGTGPARGTLPNQMPVSGYLGKGLVNSYKGGDGSIGTLTSPEFKIERKYLNFLIGGGKHPNKTCINLLVDGKVVRTATGPNDKSGGSEQLDWHTWDVAEYEGKAAVIQIVDEEKGGWGHVNVDHIVQSDAKKQAEPVSREFSIDKQYLHLPVKNGAPKRRMTFTVDKQVVREFDIELAEGTPDFWVFADVSAFKKKSLVVGCVLAGDSKSLDALKLADDVPDADKLYQEKHRPLFHFTSRRGWLNDPNGLVYHNGEWHLFYQHNPYGREWGNMHWGHAVSKDLFRWKEEGIALYPKKYGDWAFSGSAVVDNGNTSGLGTKEKPVMALAYTSTGRGECIAFSTDNGRTWKEYDGNPVVKHTGRDPKLVWYEKGKHWVMAVYDEFEKKQWIAFYTSPDLKKWTFASRIEGFYECPDLFPLREMATEDEKWVLYGADGKYLVGDFDGKEYKPAFKEKKQLWYGNFYAAQTFDNSPRGHPAPDHRVQIGWARDVTFPGTPFNQQMTVPVSLRLSGAGGPHLVARPAATLGYLHEEKPAFVVNDADPMKVAKEFTLADELDAFDLEIDLTLDKAAAFTLDLRGTKLTYDGTKGTITCKGVTAPAKLFEGKLDVRVLVDRGSVEVFAGLGRTAMSLPAIPDEKNRKLVFTPNHGDITIRIAKLYRVKSAWEK